MVGNEFGNWSCFQDISPAVCLDARHAHDKFQRAGDEDLVGPEQTVNGGSGLCNFQIQFGDFPDDKLARDSLEAAGAERRREEFPLFTQ